MALPAAFIAGSEKQPSYIISVASATSLTGHSLIAVCCRKANSRLSFQWGRQDLNLRPPWLDSNDRRVSLISGNVTVTKGNAETQASATTRDRVRSNPRRCLGSIGNGWTSDPR
jgi:hypothetical protein